MKFPLHLTYTNHPNYNCQIILDNGEAYNIYANWLHNQNLDKWQGWHCNAGVTRVYININGEVYDGECKNSRLGDLHTGWNLKDEDNSICHRTTCTGCTDDLIVTKEKR